MGIKIEGADKLTYKLQRIQEEDEKYWWDKEKNTLYRYQNNPNIKNKRWK